MLVETRAIAELSLLFGSTWTVTSIAISAILALALLSTGVAALLERPGMQRTVPLPVWWAGLGVALMVSYVFPFSALAGLGFWSKVLLGGTAAALPLLFAGVVFASLFARSSDPAGSFGANLLGALCGGALEYAALATGNRALALIATALYTLAGLAAWLKMRQVSSTEARRMDRLVKAPPRLTEA
jgi:hypothetical protein